MVIMIGRALRHVLTTHRAVRRAFPATTLERIERAVHDGESLHGGEVRFAVETALGWRALFAGQSARQRALEVFALTRTWDTERNNGVLVYVLFAERDVEIVADRGFNGRVSGAEWDQVCAAVREQFAAGAFESGALAGVGAVSALMARHFPASEGVRRDELPDRPVML
jgi:uncharacterized membrane protein